MLHVQEKWLMDIVYEEMVVQDQVMWNDDIAVYKWLGKKVEWGRIEVLKLIQIFYKRATLLEQGGI
jgi:hypothetical protein